MSHYKLNHHLVIAGSTPQLVIKNSEGEIGQVIDGTAAIQAYINELAHTVISAHMQQNFKRIID